MTRVQLFTFLKEHLQPIRDQKIKPARIAVTGIQGTGKTVFCQQWTKYLREAGLDALHISIDGFHNTREIRYRQGSDLAQGYYDDAYNETAFVDKVLKASQSDPPVVTESVYDLTSDQVIDILPKNISPRSVIITDGAFLLKEIYRPYWDLKVYLKTDFTTARSRGAHRDARALGGLQQANDKFRYRYHRASEIHLADNDLLDLSDIVIDTTDFEDLVVLKG